jgi:hypothetical protein
MDSWPIQKVVEPGGNRTEGATDCASQQSALPDLASGGTWGAPLRYIQGLLGHSGLKTTKGYLHSTDKTIRNIGSKIGEAMDGQDQDSQSRVLQRQKAG